jgi:hypothetical protein
MLIGECTNPLQNLFYVTDHAMALACCNGPWMRVANVNMELVFSACYLVVRSIIGPAVCVHMTYKLVAGREVPAPLRALWITLIWGVVIGSIPWIQECWAVLQRHMDYPASVSGEL